MKKLSDYIMHLIQGFCMALADSVPGVSGGTIAFLLGFYDKFINSLGNLMKGTKNATKEEKRKEKKDAIIFLLKLGIGWIIGFTSAVLVLSSVFESHIYSVSSLFLGFIIFAIPIVILEEKDCLKGKWKNLIFVAIGIAVVVAITILNPVSGENNAVDLTNLNFGLGVYIFVVAMVAISAMILPGISGSTLLLIFGLYMPIISGIKELLHLNFAYFPAIFIFGLGILAGIAIVIKTIQKCLEKYRTQTIYCIIGLMIGSLYSIVMGPTTLEVPQAAMSLQTFNILFFILGGVIIAGLQAMKIFLEKKKGIEE